MRGRTKRIVLIPAGVLAASATLLFALHQTGVVSLPFLPGGSTARTSGKEAGDKHARKAKDKDEKEVIPVPVELARAEHRQISAYYRASSFIEADRQVSLVAKAQGRVQKVNVEEGDWVSKGSILAELENARERIRLRQSELKLDEERRGLERRESLLGQRLITQEEFDATRAAFDLAETERDLSEIALEETLIRAPFDGQVTERRIVPGQHITLTEPVLTLVDFEPLRVRVHLPEAVARKIEPGDRVEIDIESLGKLEPAIVERVAPVVDPATSTVKLTLLFEGDPRELQVGGFVKVRVTTDTHVEALSIPKVALVEEGGLRSVFIAEADTVRKVEVQTGLHDDECCEILDGLDPGTCVVTVGQGGLRSGAKIEVLNAGAIGWTAPPDSAASKGESEDTKAEPNTDEGEVALSEAGGK
jgi:membrane fusion protein (multidrug efflux system)